MGAGTILSSFRQNDFVGCGLNLTFFVRLSKFDNVSFSCFLNVGQGVTMSWKDDYVDSDQNWVSDGINKNISGLTMTLVSLS